MLSVVESFQSSVSVRGVFKNLAGKLNNELMFIKKKKTMNNLSRNHHANANTRSCKYTHNSRLCM